MPNLPAKPTLKELQDYVREMEHERGFESNTVAQKCLLLGEEVGELFKSLRVSHGGMRIGTPGYAADAPAELADILIVLCAIANRLDVDLETAFRAKEAKNSQRTWR